MYSNMKYVAFLLFYSILLTGLEFLVVFMQETSHKNDEN